MDASLRHLGDRRSSARTRAIADLGILQARVRPGHEVSVLDISAHGVLIETILRLLPGRSIELQFERSEQLTPVRGRVIRSQVARINASWVSYRGAIGFEQPLAWVVVSLAGSEYSVLGSPSVERAHS